MSPFIVASIVESAHQLAYKINITMTHETKS